VFSLLLGAFPSFFLLLNLFAWLFHLPLVIIMSSLPFPSP
jgi:hypothetical protein